MAANNNIRLPEFMFNDTCTAIAVLKRTGAGVGMEPIFWDYGSANKSLYLFVENGLIKGSARDEALRSINATGTISIATEWAEAVWRLSKNGSAFTLEAGPYGSLVAAQNALYASTMWENTYAYPAIGSFPIDSMASAHLYRGYLAELFVYDHTLDDAAMEKINRYLNNKYGVGVSSVRGTVILLK